MLFLVGELEIHLLQMDDRLDETLLRESRPRPSVDAAVACQGEHGVWGGQSTSGRTAISFRFPRIH